MKASRILSGVCMVLALALASLAAAGCSTTGDSSGNNGSAPSTGGY